MLTSAEYQKLYYVIQSLNMCVLSISQESAI